MARYVLGRRVPDEFNTVVKVKAQQRKLGVKEDGLWGPVTEAAYKASQQPQQPAYKTPNVPNFRPVSISEYMDTYREKKVQEQTKTQLQEAGVATYKDNPAFSTAYEKTKPAYNPSNVMNTAVKSNADARLFYNGIDGTYYVPGRGGNVMINGTEYYPTNSAETTYLDPPYTKIDYGFQTDAFFTLLNGAMPDEKERNKWGYVYNESKNGKKMDTKQYLGENTLYLFNEKLYNKNETGNIVWGATMRKMGFDMFTTWTIAHAGTFILTKGKRFDEKHDIDAILAGWEYMDLLASKPAK